MHLYSQEELIETKRDDLSPFLDYPIDYTTLKEEAEQRLINSTPGAVLQNLKLVRYVEYRAMREAGMCV